MQTLAFPLVCTTRKIVEVMEKSAQIKITWYSCRKSMPQVENSSGWKNGEKSKGSKCKFMYISHNALSLFFHFSVMDKQQTIVKNWFLSSTDVCNWIKNVQYQCDKNVRICFQEKKKSVTFLVSTLLLAILVRYSVYSFLYCDVWHQTLSCIFCYLVSFTPVSCVEMFYFMRPINKIFQIFSVRIVRFNLHHAVCSFYHKFSSRFLCMLAHSLHSNKFQQKPNSNATYSNEGSQFALQICDNV